MFRSIAWWYWLLTGALLFAGLTVDVRGLVAAGVLTLFQAVHFAWLQQSFTAPAVQVRAAYLGLLIAGSWLPWAEVHWVTLAGTMVSTTTGYCALGRVVSLLPWNRTAPLDADLLRATFAPRPGADPDEAPAEPRAPRTAAVGCGI